MCRHPERERGTSPKVRWLLKLAGEITRHM
jgi:hypothetical protein